MPRRINTLSSRVLLYGALEQAAVITADIVDVTAGELRQDVGSVSRPGQAGSAGEDGRLSVLVPRVQALEAKISRQERIFRRLLDLLGGRLEPQR